MSFEDDDIETAAGDGGADGGADAGGWEDGGGGS